MKNLKLLIAAFIVVSACNKHADEPQKIKDESKFIKLSTTGYVQVSDEDLKGSRILNSNEEDTYILMEVLLNGTDYALGFFDPDHMDSILLEVIPASPSANYTVNLLAYRKGMSLGPYIEDIGGEKYLKIYNNFHLENKFNYPGFGPNIYLDGEALVYINDSSEYAYQEPAILDLYSGNTSFSYSDITEEDTLVINSERKVFGAELIVENFTSGIVELKIQNTTTSVEFPTDSLFNIYIEGGALLTTIKYLSDDTVTLYQDTPNYGNLKIKRFEVNLDGNPTNLSSALKVSITEEELTRGDTIRIN